jgi:hypothetical protein
MSYAQIIELNDEATKRACQERLEPYALDEIGLKMLRERFTGFPFPMLGDHVAEGWERVDVLEEGFDARATAGDPYRGFFVDKSGFGGDDEPAMSVAELLDALKPGYGYGLCNEGQFQITVAVYRRV